MKTPTSLITVLLALAALALTGTARAQVPQLINYTGRIAVGTVNFDGTGQLNAAIAGSADNIPGVSTLNLPMNNNPPWQTGVQPIADRLGQFINALLRP